MSGVLGVKSITEYQTRCSNHPYKESYARIILVSKANNDTYVREFRGITVHQRGVDIRKNGDSKIRYSRLFKNLSCKL